MATSENPASKALEAFVEFLARLESDGRTRFEDFVEEHPELADHLEELHDDWLLAAGALHGVEREADSPAAPKPASGSSGSSYPVELIERLTAQRPPDTRYTVRGEVDRGAMGVILEVWDADLRRRLAMKLMRDPSEPISGGRTPAFYYRHLNRFLGEAQVTGQLDHPGIPPVHELGVDGQDRLFFTMPLIEGSNLRDLIPLAREEREGWSPVRILRVILKVCEAVAFAHSRGVIHRDLKPSNIMVGRFGETYVMDWGLARVLAEAGAEESRTESPPPLEIDSPHLTATGDVIGTPCYMSPEQGVGRVHEIDQRSDVYSIGALLYHALSGRVPYQRSGEERPSAQTVLSRLREGAPEALLELAPETPTELVAISEKAMARRREDRYVDALELARDIEAFLGDRPVRARPPNVGYLLKLAVRRNLKQVVTSAAALIVILALATIFVVRLDTERADNRRLADVMASKALGRQELELYPPREENIPRIERWLERVDSLTARLPRYATVLENDRLEASERAEIRAMVDDVHALVAPRERAQRGLELARTLRSRSIDEHRAEWDRAIATIAESPLYGSLKLQAQYGLVPLGENERGLWEFWHVLSGDVPELNEAGERWAITPATGIVLVLLPGGTFTMGSDPDASFPNETLHQVELDPFFAGKYEVTQSQWQRVCGDQPTYYYPGRFRGQPGDEGLSEVNPVESISCIDAQVFCKLGDLALPTEAQWEYACRAGTRDAFCWGPDPQDLEGRENIRDISYARLHLGADAYLRFDDGFPVHAPVGSFEPNPFGLFDVHGNVTEWCQDRYGRVHTPREGDGLNLTDDEIEHVFRGGSYQISPAFARAAMRHRYNPRGLNMALGVRVSRKLDE